MKIFVLPNLASRAVSAVGFDGVPDVATAPVFETKNAFRDWCANPSTDHFFLSAFEGLDASLRVSADNPAKRIHGIIADFDATPRPTLLADLMRHPATHRPRYIHRTQSNFLRAIWAFERPVLVPSHETAKFFVRRVLREVRATRMFDGLDEEVTFDPIQYYEIGRGWEEIDSALTPAALLEAWMADAGAEKLRAGLSPDLIALPLDAVAAEADRRGWTWPGGWADFREGARGTRFWDAGDALSAIVRSCGMQCFTGERGFVPWASIFGPDFVRRTGDDVVGRATEGVFFEHPSTFYVREDRNGARFFQPMSESHLRLRLRRLGLSDARPKGATTSPVDDAVDGIFATRTVQGTVAALFNPDDVVVEPTGNRLLNVSNVRLCPASPTANPEWGNGFPLLRRFFEGLFPDDDQQHHFLAWVAHFYRAGLAGRPERGLAAFVAGPPSSGKTFLSNYVMGKIFGTTAVATNFLLGEDQFNASLFASPVWTVDDAIAPSDPRARQRYSQIVKMAVANDRMNKRGMYREGQTTEWLGRILVTLNDDPESVQLLPSTDMSIMDKLSFFRTNAAFADERWPSDEQLAPEWRPFCAWLRDWAIPPHIAVGGRFGVAPYHYPDLVRSAESAQDNRNFEDMLRQWREHWFEQNAGAEYWEGNPTMLLQALSTLESLDVVVRGSFHRVGSIRHNLNKLVNRGVRWVRATSETGRYVIYRAEACEAPF